MHTVDPITCQCVPDCARCKLLASRSLPVPQSGKKATRVKFTKPNTLPKNIVVTFDTGKQDFVKMYFFSLEYALKAVEYQLITRGWKGTVAEVQS